MRDKDKSKWHGKGVEKAVENVNKVIAPALIEANVDPIEQKVNFLKEYSVKFGLSEKHTKFEKIFLVVLTNQLIYLSSKCHNHEEDCFKLCVLLKKSELYHWNAE